MNATLNIELCPICGCDRAVPWLEAPDRFHLRTTVYHLVHCPSCSLVWLRDQPLPEEMPFHYGTGYHRAVRTSGEVNPFKRWRVQRERVLNMPKGGALLDIGCSSGAFLRTLKGEAWELYGIEISPDEAREAEATAGARVFVGDILDARFSPQSFSVITCFHVLEHVHRLKEVVERVREWLKPGGIFYVLVPNIEAVEAYIFRSYWYGLEVPRHLYHFSPSSLERLFASFGFERLLLQTSADCYVEKSIRYVLDDAVAKLGISRPPLAAADGTASLPWRVIRKAFRLGFLGPFRQLTAVAGRGSAIEAVFRKSA